MARLEAELCEICDRIYVVRNGAVSEVIDRGVSVGELAGMCGERLGVEPAPA